MNTKLHSPQQDLQPQRSTLAQAKNQFQSRPFSPPLEHSSSSNQEMPDLPAQLEQARRFGHNFANVSVSGGSPPPEPSPQWILRYAPAQNDMEDVDTSEPTHPLLQRSLDYHRQREAIPETGVQLAQNLVQPKKELGAQAFTHGNDIFFGAGKSPSVSDLTAHELTHVVQQTGGVQTKPASKSSVQLKCSVCENEEAEVQRSPDISVVSKPGIQRWSLLGDDEDKKEEENSSSGSVLDWAKEKASGAISSVTQAGSDAYDWSKEKGGAALDTVTQAGSDAYDWAKEKGGAALDTVTQAGSDAYDWAKEKGGAALDLATDVGGQALDLMSNAGGIQVDWNSEPGRIVKAWASQLDPELVQNIRGKNPADLYNLVSVPAQVQQAAAELAEQVRMSMAQSAAPTISTSGAIQMYAPAAAPAPLPGPVSTPGPVSGVYPVGTAPGASPSAGRGLALLLSPIGVAIIVFLAIMFYSKSLNEHEDEYLKEDRKRDEEKRKKLKDNLGDCTEEQHRTLQDEVDKQCKHEYPGKGVDQDKKGLERSCNDDTLGCAELRSRWQRNERCAKAREDVNEKCYKGGDTGHKEATESARRAEEKCREQYRKKKC